MQVIISVIINKKVLKIGISCFGLLCREPKKKDCEILYGSVVCSFRVVTCTGIFLKKCTWERGWDMKILGEGTSVIVMRVHGDMVLTSNPV